MESMTFNDEEMRCDSTSILCVRENDNARRCYQLDVTCYLVNELNNEET